MRSMAVTCSFPPHVLVQKSGPIIKPVSRFLMLKHSEVPVKKALALQIRSSFKTKVFEDRSEGIICYRDASGEIICEGYDEGPRFHQQIPRTTCNPRDAEIMNLLQQQWLQIINNADKGVVAVREDLHWKWP